jgi:hypothetical protein
LRGPRAGSYNDRVPLVRLQLVAVLGLALSVPAGAEEITKWTDAQGRVHYSNRGGPAGAETRHEDSSSGERGWESVLERNRGAREVGERAETAINSLLLQVTRKKRERARALGELEVTQTEIARSDARTAPVDLPALRDRELAQATAVQKIDLEIAALHMQIAKLRAVKAVGADALEKSPFAE